MAENTINDLINLLNVSDTILRYNSEIEADIRTQGGTVLYSYNNIIIASEIDDAYYNELKKNPNIEYIESLPLKKYGDIDITLIDQIDQSKILLGGTGSGGIVNTADLIVISGITGTTIVAVTVGTDGVSGKSKSEMLKNINTSGSTVVSTGTGSAAIILNQNLTLTASTIDTFSYLVMVSGTAPISLQFIRPSNYVGDLSMQNNNTITGQSSPGIYNIKIVATNGYGTDVKNLTLTVLDPVKITNTNLTAYTKVGANFLYSIESSGSLPKSYSITGQPAGISLSDNTISGIIYSGGTFSINMTVTGLTNSDSKVLTVDSGNAPVITSLGEWSIEQNSATGYTMTSAPSSGVTYNFTGMLPDGLMFKVDPITNVATITGSSTQTGIKQVNMIAINNYGQSTKILKITTYQMNS